MKLSEVSIQPQGRLKLSQVSSQVPEIQEDRNQVPGTMFNVGGGIRFGDVPSILARTGNALLADQPRTFLKHPLAYAKGGPVMANMLEGINMASANPDMMAGVMPSTKEPYPGTEFQLPKTKTISGEIAGTALENTVPFLGGFKASKSRFYNEPPLIQTPLEKAHKLTAELLQPGTKETGGIVSPSVEEASKVIKRSRTFDELYNNLKGHVKDLFEQRDKILREQNFSVNSSYIDRAENDIVSKFRKGELTRDQTLSAKKVIDEERRVYNRAKNPDRVWVQERKEYLQDQATSFLEDKGTGKPVVIKPGKHHAYDSLQRHSGDVAEAGDPIVAEINSRYGGLKEATKLVKKSGMASLKSVPETFLERHLPFLYGPSRYGAAAKVTRELSEFSRRLPKITSDIEKFSKQGASLRKPFKYTSPLETRSFDISSRKLIEPGKGVVYGEKPSSTKVVPKQLSSPRLMLESPKGEPIIPEPIYNQPRGKFSLESRYNPQTEMSPGIERRTLAIRKVPFGKSQQMAEKAKRIREFLKGKGIL